MENINAIINLYMKTIENRKALEKQENELKQAIFDHIGKGSYIETDDYFVSVKETISERIDTKALYKDFPDIKKTYGKISVSRSLVPTVKNKVKTA